MGKVRSKRVRERPWLTENQTHRGEHNFKCFILLAPLQNLHYQSLLFYYKSQHKLQLKALALVCYRVLVQAGNSQERKEDADLALSSRLDAASGFGKLPTPISFLSLLTFNQTNGNNKVGHRPGLGFKPAYTRMHNLSAENPKQPNDRVAAPSTRDAQRKKGVNSIWQTPASQRTSQQRSERLTAELDRTSHSYSAAQATGRYPRLN